MFSYDSVFELLIRNLCHLEAWFLENVDIYAESCFVENLLSFLSGFKPLFSV